MVCYYLLRNWGPFLSADRFRELDTVSCGVQTAIYHLLQRPEMWNRLRNEIIAVQRKGLCLGSVVRYDDAAQLPYLDACIKEALRIVAPIPCKIHPSPFGMTRSDLLKLVLTSGSSSSA